MAHIKFIYNNSMDKNNIQQNIAIVGGGPAALFMVKHIVERKITLQKLTIFERFDRLGVGMPYGKMGAGKEHLANVSANELPLLAEDFESYVQRFPPEGYASFCQGKKINPYEVVPRGLLGDYLEHSFHSYIGMARSLGITIDIRLDTCVEDIIPGDGGEPFRILTSQGATHADVVILCTGHVWPLKNEGKINSWYDSPYPPSKISLNADFPVAIRGASLTAVDAIKTLARANGKFRERPEGGYDFILNEDSSGFRIDLFSTRGFLPALRFHSEDKAFSSEWTMGLDEINEYKAKNGGFVDLDHVFERNFLIPLSQRDPDFYSRVKDLGIEEFTERMLQIREEIDAIKLFMAEFREAEKSIKRQQSISWKEALSAFSYAINYPAKHLSAEDMVRHKKVLMPLISIVIASLPQASYHEMIALYEQDLLRNYAVGEESEFVPNATGSGCKVTFVDDEGDRFEENYEIFVDAIGQRPMHFNDLPFDGLKTGKVTSGFLFFKDEENAKKHVENGAANVYRDDMGKYFMKVTGLAINDNFQALDTFGAVNPSLFIMAVPFISGVNPDFSGLDFCDTAAERIANMLGNNDMD
ncbi:FAD/NAD(P)-binding protein [Sphingobacterium mizutaii]|uniref:FAD/NAD(P)-binding protein n=1 Tax=Sphingobacterium mizutaii TaxID=1010 RepID=UPI0016286693|nr:FAD/NAD(P)-binding protein [Sphingobacterium mizutaii]MBV2227614.1 FAD/NAD(P)-binding protein [Sphingobacterium mizutaii]